MLTRPRSQPTSFGSRRLLPHRNEPAKQKLRGAATGRVVPGHLYPGQTCFLTRRIDESDVPQYRSVHHGPLELGEEVVAELSRHDRVRPKAQKIRNRRRRERCAGGGRFFKTFQNAPSKNTYGLVETHVQIEMPTTRPHASTIAPALLLDARWFHRKPSYNK